MNSVKAFVSPDLSVIKSSNALSSNPYIGSPFLNLDRKNPIAAQRHRLTASTDDFSKDLNVSSRVLTIAVVGLSGFQSSGGFGVGKSCLCNRFVRPWEDSYRTDHISTVSTVDFGGRVINNDHWLYWGDHMVPIHKDGSNEDHWLQFRIIEHTEFVDDISFQPFKNNSTAELEPYSKRCSVVKLHSADKLMYISKDQLGMESDYERRNLPDGKASVDGFLCVYDVSQNSSNQVQSVTAILQSVLKLKKPVVLAATKMDEMNEVSRKNLDQILNRKEFKNLGSNLVETSSHLNVNVETAFLLLAHLIDKSCGVSKPKPKLFKDALKIHQDVINALRENYLNLLSREVRESKITWDRLIIRLSQDPDYQKFVDASGSLKAKLLFDQYVFEMKERRAQKRLQKQMERLPEVLQLLPFDISDVKNKPWPSVISILASTTNFDKYFVSTPNKDSFLDSVDQPKERRLPIDLLYTVEAEAAFYNLLTKLEIENKNKRLRQEFIDELMKCGQVTPGKSLDDVKIFLIGKECYETMDPNDLQMTYDQYQKQLIRSARRDFLELLNEHIEQFVECIFIRPLMAPQAETGCFGVGSKDKRHLTAFGAPLAHSNVAAPAWAAFLTTHEMEALNELLREDFRYRYLNRLYQMRDHMIGQFANFVKYPLTQHCPAESRCIDLLVDDLLDNLANMLPSKSDTDLSCKDINLLIVDADGMGRQFVDETRAFLTENDICLDGFTFRFNYDCAQPFDPFSLPFLNDFSSADCIPDGVICVFSCRSSLEKIERCLLKESAAGPWASRLLLLLACDPANLDDLPYLQQRGAQLSAKLAPKNDVPFVGLEPSHSHVTAERRATRSSAFYFTDDQIALTLKHFCRCKLTLDSHRRPTIDLCVTVCLMCGDEFAPELILGPFLKQTIDSNNFTVKNSTSAIDTKSFFCQIFAPSLSRKLVCQISLASFHSASAQCAESDEISFAADGFILVYSAKRKASFCYLNSLVRIITANGLPGQILICAIGNVAEFFSDSDLNSLITKGNDLADRLDARFLTICEGSEPQTSLFTQFLADLWLQKNAIKSPSQGNLSEHMNKVHLKSCHDDTTSNRHANIDFPVPSTSSYEFLSQYSSGDVLKRGINVQKSADDKTSIALQAEQFSENAKHKNRATTWYNDRVAEKNRVPGLNSDELLVSISTRNRGQSLKSMSSYRRNQPSDQALDQEETFSLIEPVELEAEYMTVKDALSGGCSQDEIYIENEAQYATIGSILFGRTPDSDEKLLSAIKAQDSLSHSLTFKSVPDSIPLFVRKCVEIVELEGLNVEGIYRVPGNQTQVSMLEEKFRQNPSISFQSLNFPVNVFTTALKNFFATLKQPLIPCNLYEVIKSAMSLRNAQDMLVEVKRIIGMLPIDNIPCLKYLVDHLIRVAEHSSETAMDYRNLAKCWWPTLLRPQFDTFESMALMTHKLELFVQILLENSKFVFS